MPSHRAPFVHLRAAILALPLDAGESAHLLALLDTAEREAVDAERERADAAAIDVRNARTAQRVQVLMKTDKAKREAHLLANAGDTERDAYVRGIAVAERALLATQNPPSDAEREGIADALAAARGRERG